MVELLITQSAHGEHVHSTRHERRIVVSGRIGLSSFWVVGRWRTYQAGSVHRNSGRRDALYTGHDGGDVLVDYWDI